MIKQLKDYFNGLDKKDLGVIFLAALTVRLVALYFFGLNNCIGPDCNEYDTYAVNLLKDHYYHLGDIRSFRAPLYPFFLAFIYAVFGHSFAVVKIIQAVIGSLTCVLAYLTGLEIHGRKTAFIAGLITCFYFAMFDNSAYIASETLFVFLIAVSVLLLLKAGENSKLLLLSGVFVALSALARPTTMIFPAFAVPWLFIRLGFKKGMTGAIIFCAGFILTIAPWTIRNYMVHNAFLPISSMSGDVFWASNNPWSKGRQCQVKMDYAQYYQLPEVARDKAYFQEGLKWLKSQSSAQLVKLYFLKFTTLFYPFLPECKTGLDTGSMPELLKGKGLPGFINAYDPTFGFVLPFWIIGMYLAVKQKDKQSFLLAGMILVFLASALIFYAGETRFRTAYSPYVAVFAAAGIVAFLRKPFGPAAVVTWGALNAGIFIFNGYFYALLQLMLSGIRGS